MTVHLDRRGVASTGDTEYGCSSGAPAAERGLATSVSAEFARPPRPPARKVEPHGSPDRLPALLAARLAQLLLGGVALGLAAGGDLAIMLARLLGLAALTGAADQRRVGRQHALAAHLAAAHDFAQPQRNASWHVAAATSGTLVFGWHNRT
jgi:hypothetical protein